MSIRLRDALMRELGALRYELIDRVAFFNEHVDIVVGGARLARPQTPWSRR